MGTFHVYYVYASIISGVNNQTVIELDEMMFMHPPLKCVCSYKHFHKQNECHEINGDPSIAAMKASSMKWGRIGSGGGEVQKRNGTK